MAEYISAEGLEKLKRELEELKTTERRAIAERLEAAKALGDLSENAEYQEAKEAQSLNEGKIQELERVADGAGLPRQSRGRQGGDQDPRGDGDVYGREDYVDPSRITNSDELRI